MSESKVFEFTVYFGEAGSTKSEKDVGTKTASLHSDTKSSDVIMPSQPDSPISDNDMLRVIKSIETGGGSGGYSMSRSDTGVYGAYQVKKSVWQDEIKSKFGWDFEDWFQFSPEQGDSAVFAKRQDRIAKELLLPSYKRAVANERLYDTPLGRHLPKGSLEILSQLGVGNLRTFLNTGYDATAFGNMQNGQIMGYLEKTLSSFNKKIPDSFSKELEGMGGVKTKYTRK